jgi:hypothetical protein
VGSHGGVATANQQLCNFSHMLRGQIPASKLQLKFTCMLIGARGAMLSASAAQLIYVAAFGALVLGLGGVITTSVVLGTPAASTMAMMGHIVVADAGSTHTGDT